MKTKKISEMTPEELAAHKAHISAVRSQAGRKGGATMHANAKGRSPTRTITVREPDYKVIVAWANKQNTSLAECFHKIASTLAKNDPSLGK